MDPNFIHSAVTAAPPASSSSETSPFDQTSSLDNPHVDKIVNAGTTAANCQPRHTREQDEVAAQVAAEMEAELDLLDDLSPASSNDNHNDLTSSPDDTSSALGSSSNTQRRRAEKKAMKEQAKVKKLEEKKAAVAAAKEKEEMDPRKMGYIQMAKMGYQELVNAIIRPPRAEYKVCIL